MIPLFLVIACLVAFDGGDTNVVGTGVKGFSGDGASPARAQLDGPFDVALDSRGNLHISDTGNQRIRRFDPSTGIITTVVGNGSKGFAGDGGPATSAKIDEPYGIAIDGGDNLYFVDRLNRRIRRVDSKTGIITTAAGDGSKAFSGDGGPATRAGLVEPNGIALDGKGRLFVADVADQRVRLVDLMTGIITTFAGTGKRAHEGDGGPASKASIAGPRAVEVGRDGTVWVLEREGNTLRAVDPKTGLISTRAGTGKKGYTGDGGPAIDATFNGPKELGLDAGGNIFVVDTENHAIRRIDAATGRITTVAGDGHKGEGDIDGPGSDRLDRPHGVAATPDGSILIGDTGRNRVCRVRPR
jgi:streptogramin lyase